MRVAARWILVLAATLLGIDCGLAQAQTLVWQDEFNGPAIDGSKWTFDVGNGCDVGICGWGNGELQAYTAQSQNVRIENGVLVIEARRERQQATAFSSARLKTDGRMAFRYGTLEARIRYPQVGNGLWPAFWTLGASGVWPGRGEIDIMEAGSAAAIAAGTVERTVTGATHWDFQGSQADYSRSYTHPTALSGGFHVYRLTWDPAFIRAYVDGILYFEFAISDIEGASLHEFHQPHFVLLNLAVGGSYTGVTTSRRVTAPLPAKMEIDYIRLYQNSGDTLVLGAP